MVLLAVIVQLGAFGAQAAPVKILALGDSLTAGYGLPAGEGFVPQLEKALRAQGLDARVLDGGVSGDTTAGGLARLDWALAEDPQVVIVELGANDALRGLDPGQAKSNLDAILAKLTAQHRAVLLAGMLAPRNLGADYVNAFDANGAFVRRIASASIRSSWGRATAQLAMGCIRPQRGWPSSSGESCPPCAR
jgi:acyl-CoA thioesterase-1